jgi:hypothetical protein
MFGQLTGSGGNERELIRLCAQDTNDALKAWELSANRDSHSKGMSMELVKCKAGGSVAVVKLGHDVKYAFFGIFNQGSDGQIYTRWLHKGRWGRRLPVIPRALPPTAIAAVHTEGNSTFVVHMNP